MNDEHLREQLFNLLQRSGVKDQIKAKLRSDLIKLVDKNGTIGANGTTNGPNNAKISDLTNQKSSLLTKFTNQLILSHLKKNKYDYAASVFESEASLGREQIIKLEEFMTVEDKKHKELLEGNDLNKVVSHLLNSKSSLISKFNSKYSDMTVQTDSDLLSYLMGWI